MLFILDGFSLDYRLNCLLGVLFESEVVVMCATGACAFC